MHAARAAPATKTTAPAINRANSSTAMAQPRVASGRQQPKIGAASSKRLEAAVYAIPSSATTYAALRPCAGWGHALSCNDPAACSRGHPLSSAEAQGNCQSKRPTSAAMPAAGWCERAYCQSQPPARPEQAPRLIPTSPQHDAHSHSEQVRGTGASGSSPLQHTCSRQRHTANAAPRPMAPSKNCCLGLVP